MSLGIIVFARLSSRRLPGKALLTVAGRPLLGRVFDRLRQTKSGGEIVLATTTDPGDDPLVAFANQEEVRCFRGSLNDVCGRAINCAQQFQFQKIVRICGDSPFIDAGLMDLMIDEQARTNADIVTNLFPRTFAPGLSVEVLPLKVLEDIHALSDGASDLEHVTQAIYRHPEQFHILNHAAPHEIYQGLNLTVDTPDDLSRAEWITSQVNDPAIAPLSQITALARDWTAHTGHSLEPKHP